MPDVSRAADWANVAVAFSIVALTLSSLRVRRSPIAARSWLFFGLASLTLLAHASLDLMTAEYAQFASVMQLATSALLGAGFVLLYGADRDGVEKVEKQAEQDTLTGLLNLRSFRAAAAQRTARTVDHKGSCAVAVLDLDGFKDVNDTKGHPAGDRVLQAVASAIKANLRAADLAARYGGDEFVILLDRCDRLEARRIAQRIRWSVEVLTAARGSRVSLSCGVAVCPESGRDIDELIHKADAMLLAVKRGGKNDIKLANGA
ncbi:MAG TPA: GGDEF domain-containing protein [Candidatus Limnocylindria bacterium]|nr:GGDEF domain-containing protein [Candidatus Limnocylindria bacterium]